MQRFKVQRTASTVTNADLFHVLFSESFTSAIYFCSNESESESAVNFYHFGGMEKLLDVWRRKSGILSLSFLEQSKYHWQSELGE